MFEKMTDPKHKSGYPYGAHLKYVFLRILFQSEFNMLIVNRPVKFSNAKRFDLIFFLSPTKETETVTKS